MQFLIPSLSRNAPEKKLMIMFGSTEIENSKLYCTLEISNIFKRD